jgi:hypothetical protein
MDKMKVRLKAHRHIYIHNDIGNAAFYFKNRVEVRAAKGDRDGIGLEIMAGLTLLAFEIEARFNFLGAKLIQNWNEHMPALVKVKKVCKHLGVTPDFAARPYLSVTKLKDFRDTLAHGKPEDKYLDEEVVATAEELEAMGILHADWQSYLNEAFLQEAYEDAELIWKDLLAKSGLTIFDTMTHGGSQMSFIEDIADKSEAYAATS